jgi:hypothetical protein
MRVAVAIAAMFVSSCCDSPRCLSWVTIGETYEIELVQHYNGRHKDAYHEPAPFERFPASETSCGEKFDLELGKKISFAMEGWQDRPADSWACEDCVSARGSFVVAGVTEAWGGFGGHAYGGLDAFQMKHVGVGVGCYGSYWIGISAKYPKFLTEAGEYVATDLMLFRQFAIDEGSTCLAGSLPSPVCWDSWAVRIRDSRGRLITKDVPAPADASVPLAGDAGAVDAGLADGAMP